MNISNLISTCSPIKNTTVLGAIWTDKKDLCCESMLKNGEQMLTDMVECQDLIASLDIACKENIDIPKLSAELIEQEDDWDFVKVIIESKVSEEFAQLIWNIQDGKCNYGLTYRLDDDSFPNITVIKQSVNMNNYIFSAEDNVKIINATLDQ